MKDIYSNKLTSVHLETYSSRSHMIKNAKLYFFSSNFYAAGILHVSKSLK